VPGGVFCGGASADTQRLCRCDAPSNAITTFGFGYSDGAIYTTETTVFHWFVAPGDVGVMTHFWTTYFRTEDDGVIIRYYVDGETDASLVFTPSLSCGVGFYDTQAAWGTKWFGKGAEDGGYFLNFRIPFRKSIVDTTQHMYGTYGAFFLIMRGGTNLPINIGGIDVPLTSARLQLFTTNATYQPLDWVTLVSLPAGTTGIHFMHTLSVSSGNLNFLEGCYHMYSPPTQDFPGTLLSTGTEDYFDSAWYFNAGQFHLPVSGFTHLNQTGPTTWSAYRFHEMDPLQFNDGFELVWRNGDTFDPAGIKCMMSEGGGVAGNPTESIVLAYAWAYTWDSSDSIRGNNALPKSRQWSKTSRN